MLGSERCWRRCSSARRRSRASSWCTMRARWDPWCQCVSWLHRRRFDMNGPRHTRSYLGRVANLHDHARTRTQELKAAIDSNVTSTIILTSVALEVLLDKTESFDMVDISSGAARRPSATWASYCSTKAARYMFMQVLAAEEVRAVYLVGGSLDRVSTDSRRVLCDRARRRARCAHSATDLACWLPTCSCRFNVTQPRVRSRPSSATCSLPYVTSSLSLESSSRVGLIFTPWHLC